jgi:NAD(P)H-hydrate epimerase
VVAAQAPEVVQLGDEWSDTHIQDADVVVIGPGIGLSESAVWKVKRVIEQISKGDTGRLKCVIFDGDALTILGKYYPDWSEVIVQMSGSGVTTILTPHLGEWKRLFDKNVGSEIEMAEISRSAIRNIPNLIVVTKGARTGIVDSKSILVNVTGNDGMATCGSGDVLTGIIGAMVCNMPDVRVAVGAGVFIHGLAGDIAESSLGKDGVTASDIMNKIPGAIEKIRQEKNILQATYFPQIV